MDRQISVRFSSVHLYAP